MATDDAVTTISESLKETDELPRKQIAEIVEVLGAAVALSLLDETRRVQDEGGIEVRDGTRRRTDGGVFFSLAKGKLPKADRNRIFRVRPPKSPDEATPPSAQQSLPLPEVPREPVVRPVAKPEERPRPAAPPSAKQVPATGLLGRRRVVEVEVLRQHARPALERVPEVRAAAPSAPRQAAAVREERPEPQEVRPLRRIVTVAPAVREEAPPSTPEAAIEKMRIVISGLKVGEQRRVTLDLLKELGWTPPEPKAKPEPKREPPPPPPPPPQKGLDAQTKERVLASVTDALGLSTADLAEVLYGDDTPGLRAKARTVMDRFRKS